MMTIEQVDNSRLDNLDIRELPFGEVFTDHMYICTFKDGEWDGGKIQPYSNLNLSPAMQGLHYGQTVFEGMKAYRNSKDEVVLFRPEENQARLNRSAKRMCMPELPENLFMDGLMKLLEMDSNWVPSYEGFSLYIRPFMFASGIGIKARPSEEYTFMIICSPVAAYYSQPVKLLIEEKYTRAALGGTGNAKAGGNYGGSFFPAGLAQEKGYDQLVWTDGVEHKYIEEAGTMNIFFRIGDKLVTPALTNTILEGITRKSVIELARHMGIVVEEKQISIDDLISSYKNGDLKEAFGVGTAATVSLISHIGRGDYQMALPENQVYATNIKETLDDIRMARKTDALNWITKVC
jgi:branched-chain amino acid aminotransferase